MKPYKYLPTIFAVFAAAYVGIIGASADEPEITSVSVTQTDASTTTSTQPTETEISIGWQENSEGKKCYITEDGTMLTGYQQIADKEYYFAANGTVKCGWYTVNNIRMYFSPENFERQIGWINYNGNKLYADETGKLTGYQTIDSKDYIFDEFGVEQTGWFEYEGSKYYSDHKTGLYEGRKVIDNTVYLFSSKGKFKSGWQTIDNIRIFYDYETMQPVYGFIKYNGNIYYADEIKGKHTGESSIGGIKYKFSDKGILQTGFQKFSDGVRYYDKDGNAVLGFANINGKKYYFNSKYIMQIGFTEIDGNTYYFNDKGELQTGWQNIDKKKYYFGSDGVMRIGFNDIDGKKYYFDKNGVMLTNTNIDGYDIDENGIAIKISAIQKRANEIIEKIGKSADAIYTYVNTHNIYRYMEATKTLEQINEIGWGYFANYSIDNPFVVCYYFAALQDILFQQAGFESRIIYGTGRASSDHYWNQVKINGEWRNYDACNSYKNVSDDYLKGEGYTWYEYVYPTYND